MKRKQSETLCLECGKKMKSKVLKQYEFESSGLPVVLASVTQWGCRNGHTEVEIPNPAGLYEALARLIARKQGELAPNEIRFLRTHLGLSGRDFADEMSVDPVTVSRWENGRKPMGPQSEKLLRIMALTQKPLSKYPEVEELGSLEMTHRGGKWGRAA